MTTYVKLNSAQQFATGVGIGSLELGSVSSSKFKTLIDAGLNEGSSAYVRIQHADNEVEWENVLITRFGNTIIRTFDENSDSATGALIAFSTGNKLVTGTLPAKAIASVNDPILVDLPSEIQDLNEKHLQNQAAISSLQVPVGFSSTQLMLRFITGEEDPAFAWLGPNYEILMSWSVDDELLLNNIPVILPQPLLPYVDSGDNTLHAVGATDQIAAKLGSFNALAVQTGNDKHVRAVINKPQINAVRSIAAGPGKNLLVPNDDRILHVIIGIGRSLMTGALSAETPVNTSPTWPTDVFMFDSGINSDVRMGLETQGDVMVLDPATLVGFMPLFSHRGQGSGHRGQTVMESMAASLATVARAIGTRFRVLCFTAAQGGVQYDVLKKGTQVWANMLAATTKAKALAESMGLKIVVDCCLLKHGEGGVEVNYYDELIEWQSDANTDLKAITGQAANIPFVMNMPSALTVDQFTAATAMLSAHNNSAMHNLSGCDYPYGAYYATLDYEHFQGPGYALIGETMARAVMQTCWSSTNKSDILQMTAATRSGNNVTLTYHVPVPPLVFSTPPGLTERDVKGFRFTDSSGDRVVNSATITDNGTGAGSNPVGTGKIVLALATTPNGTSEAVLYAWSPQATPRTPEARIVGSLHDSAPNVAVYADTPLPNWAIMQRFTL